MLDKQQLISFIVNNDKLELLKARINRFNPFKVLKIQDYEIRHSNLLAWLFNPSENHNFDDKVLKRFILKVLLKSDNNEILQDMNLIYKLHQMSLMDIKVYREIANIDILLVSEQHKIVIFIENKVYSEEHSNQLSKYYNYVNNKYKSFLIIPIYLTLNGEIPNHKKYFLASYEDLLESIEFILDNYKERTSSEVISFLEYYIHILKEKYVMDNELKKMCKEIYQQYKEIIDMLYTVGNEINTEPAAEIFKNKHKEIIQVAVTNKTYWFGVESFAYGRKNDKESWGGGFPVCFWFSEYFGKLKLTLEIGPFEDANKRIKFLEKLEMHGVKINNKAKEPGRQYTRIYTRTSDIKDWTDFEEISDAMEELYENKELRELKNRVEQAIKEFDW
ncbi:PD-(D/E)XK nuclease family protein [Thermovenabulum gondwanense]|uniref:PD-(D/E)XK nuclease superfamily protein n=1 Tax=Thermovenabulum gondwanense TaxID=520767 RepID=A0A162MYH9_9FIRM|nr:PD-(D/E)XK nuclease family protein [Thermovenabulum gondwanense]KYO68557.1 hypothetical protein ATZ99_00660 [Thermovenabulum gondwanense]